MADFSIVTRKMLVDSKDLADVYISVAHNGATRYIKTQYKVNKKGVKETINRLGKIKQEVKDAFVYRSCMNIIDDYQTRCNRLKDANKLTCNELIDILSSNQEDISFSEFARDQINRMINENRDGAANNYNYALKSLSSFLNKENILFSQITSKYIKSWIESLKDTNRAKNMYPTAIKALFKLGADHYNDYDREIIVIGNDPFRGVKIPRSEQPEKKAIEAKEIKSFFASSIIKEKSKSINYNETAQRMALDVCRMIFFLAGINAADLYDLETNCLKDWTLCYNRKKTRNRRLDKSYIEITVPEEIRDLFEKYKGKKKLFYFSERYNTPNAFVKYIDYALSDICKQNSINPITTYTFRHSWATIARNKCNVSLEDVAFCLNHTSAHKITDGYIEKDFSKIDRVNKKVIEYVFNKTINKTAE